MIIDYRKETPHLMSLTGFCPSSRMVFKKKIGEQTYELKRNCRPPVGEVFQGEQFPVEEEYVLAYFVALSRYSFFDVK